MIIVMKDLIEYIKTTTGFAESTIVTIVDSAIAYLAISLRTNSIIKIENFGTVKVIDKPEREGRNPRTGEMTQFKATKKIKFVPNKNFLLAIQKDPKADEEIKSELEVKVKSELAFVPEILPSIPTEFLPETLPSIPTEFLPSTGLFTESVAKNPTESSGIPPIPTELLPKVPELMWDIKAPDNSFVKVMTSDLPKWGVTPTTPIYSPATGWQLASNIPELAGIV